MRKASTSLRPNELYNVELERQLLTEHNLQQTILEISKLSLSSGTATLDLLLEVTSSHLQNSLYGCAVDVGLYTDSNNKVLEFYVNKAYARTIYRGESGCFVAMDKKEIVVEIDAMQNLVVFVPLVGTSKSYGVLEIHGLYPDDERFNVDSFRRSSDQLRAMMAAKDYKFTATARFWKKLLMKKYAGMDQVDTHVTMSGMVKEVVFTRNGVPFYGGPRYNIMWENGQLDAELSANELLQLFQETPQSLGVFSRLDADLSSKLLYIGFMLGTFLENRKCELYLHELRAKMAVQRVNVVGMIEIALQSIVSVLTGVKEMFLIGHHKETGDSKSLVHYSYMKGNRATEKYEFTAFQILPMLLEEGSMAPFSRGASRGSEHSIFRQEDNYGTDWLGKELFVPRSFKWGKSAHYDRYFLILHKSYSPIGGQAFSKFDNDVVHGVVEEVKTTISVLWQHDQRRKNLREFIKIAEGKLLEWRNLEINEICFNLLNFIPEDLIQAHLYVGLLHRGGNVLKYIAANKSSHMEGQELSREEGISFDVIDTTNTIMLQMNDFQKKSLLVVGAVVDVYYGKKLYKGVIKKIGGHEKYDVEYKFDRKTEVGVDINRILPISRAFRAKQFNKYSKLPFIGVAVRHGNKVLGVLGCDHIEKSSLENGQISHDVQVFLEQIGRLIGSTIDVKLKKSALQSMYRISKNQHAEIRDLVTTVIDVIHECSACIHSVTAAQYSTQTSYQDYFTVVKNQLPPKILDQKGTMPKQLEKKVMRLDFSKYGHRAIQKQGNDSLLLLTHMKALGSSNVNFHTNSGLSLAGGQGLLFVIAVSHNTNIPDIDYEFYETLQKSINTVLFAIMSQKASSEIRHDALLSINNICNTSRFPNRHEFFHGIADIVSSCYHSTNMYVGVLTAFNRDIHYMLASRQSIMLHKKLSRTDFKGISFAAIDEDKSLCILANSKMAGKLKHFGERQRFEYPFIVTPIVCHIDSIVGVLAADNCAGQQILSDAEESLGDVISFFNSISLYLNKAVRYYRIEDTIKDMQYITETSQSYAEGIGKLLKLVFHYLPFAKRIHHVTFQPCVMSSANINDDESVRTGTRSVSTALEKEILRESYTIALAITRLCYVNKEMVNPQIKIYWQGNCIYTMLCAVSDHIHEQPMLIKIPKSIPYSDAVVIVKIFSQVTNENNNTIIYEKEMCQKVLDLRYFIHTPLTVQYHTLFSTSLCNLKCAELGILSKMTPSDALIGYYVDSAELKFINSKGTRQAEETFHSSYKEVFISFYWENVNIGRSRFGADSVMFKWESLDLFIPVHFKSPHQGTAQTVPSSDFIVELSTLDNKGQPVVLGTLLLAQLQLQEYLSGKPAWLEVQKGSLQSNGSSAPKSSQQTADFVGFFVQFSGENITGHNALHTKDYKDQVGSNYHVLFEMLKLPRASNVTKNQGRESTLIESKKLVSFQNRSDGIKCEIGVLAARDLFIAGNPHGHDVLDRSMNTIVKVFFNNELIGSSSIVYDNYSPVWNSERFYIVLFPDDDMEDNVLHLELFRHIEDGGAEEQIGSVEVKGFELTTLLMGSIDHEAWFDFMHINYPPRNYMITTKKVLKNERHKGNRLLTSQIKVCGRLTAQSLPGVKTTGKAAKDQGYLELNILSVSGLVISIAKAQMADDILMSASYIATVYFNDRLLWTTEPVDLLGHSSHFNDRDEAADELVFSSEKVMFRYPSSKSLYQSKLRIDVLFAKDDKSGGTEASHRSSLKNKTVWVQYASAVITASQLVSFLGQSGTVTKTFTLRVTEDDGLQDKRKVAKIKQKGKAHTTDAPLTVQLRGGPEDAPEVYQYDDYMLCLDLLAAIELPHRYVQIKASANNPSSLIKQASSAAFPAQGAARKLVSEDTRPEIYCVVTWNGKIMGKTSVFKRSTHLLFYQQRMILPVPIFNVTQPRLFQCNLQIELYDCVKSSRVAGKVSEKLLGTVFLDGFAIEQFCTQHKSHVEWFGIGRADKGPPRMQLTRIDSYTGSVRSSEGSERQSEGNGSAKYTQSNHSDSDADYCGHLKIQLTVVQTGTGNESDGGTSQLENGDYLLRVVEAKSLSNTDPYGGANAMVDIIWNGRLIGSTQVIRNSVDPQFDCECFVLRADTITKLMSNASPLAIINQQSVQCLLELQVWSLALNKPKDFLGRVLIKNQNFFELAGKQLDPARPSENRREFLLRPSDEFTSEENALVHGSLVVELSTINYKNFIHSQKMAEEVIIWINSAQFLPEVSVWNYEPLYYCRIIRSYDREGGAKIEVFRTQVVNSFNPRYQHEYCSLTVPADEDWTGFVLEFEICYREMVLASLVLSPESLRALVLRADESVTECLSFPMHLSQDIASAPSHGAYDHSDKVSIPMLHLGGGLKSAFDSKVHTIEEYYSKIASQEAAELMSIDSEALLSASDSVNADHQHAWPAYFTTAEAQVVEIFLLSVEAKDKTNVLIKAYWNSEEKSSCRATDISMSASRKVVVEKAIGSMLLDGEFKLVANSSNGDQMAAYVVRRKEMMELLESRQAGLTFVLDSETPQSAFSVHVWARLKPNAIISHLINPAYPLPKYGCELSIGLVAASDLTKASLLGSTDAFAVITYCGTVLLETTVIKERLDPVWSEQQFATLRFPNEIDPFVSLYGRNAEPTGIDRSPSLDDQSAHDSPVGQDLEQPVDDLWVVDDFELIIELFSFGKNNRHTFLGAVELRGMEFIKMLFHKSVYRMDWLTLSTTQRKPLAEQKLVSRQSKVSVVVSRLASSSDNRYLELGKDVDVFVLSARGLIVEKNADVFVVVRAVGSIASRTYTDKACGAAPRWDNEKVTVRMPLSLLEHTLEGSHDHVVMEFEVWQARPKKGDLLLGIGQLTYQQLQTTLDNDNARAAWIPLRKCSYLPAKVQLADCSGDVEIRFMYSNPLISSVSANDLLTYKLSVKRINGLPAGFSFGGSNYIVIAKWNDREVGRTNAANVKGTAPAWQDQDITLCFDKMKTNISESVLLLQVWNQGRLFSGGDCVGNVVLTGDRLATLLQAEDQRTSHSAHDRRDTSLIAFPLGGEQSSSTSVKALKKVLPGELEISVESLDLTTEEEFGNKGAVFGSRGLKDISVRWQDLVDVQAGSSVIEIKLVSATLSFISSNLLHNVATTRNSIFSGKKEGINACSVMCRVVWCGKAVFDSAPMLIEEVDQGTKVIAWSQDVEGNQFEHVCYLNNGIAAVSQNEKVLRFELWLADSNSREEPLAVVDLPFQIIIRLYCGQFTFPLQPGAQNSQINSLTNSVSLAPGATNTMLNKWHNKLWQSSLTFQMKFVFPFWDSIKYSAPSIYKRKIAIYGADLLPVVDNEFPNTKCAMSIDDVVVAKCQVVLATTTPEYSRLYAEIMIDLTKRLDIKVQVIHVHTRTRKEVILGEENIPFEYLLKPPAEPFDLYLGPSRQRQREGGDLLNNDEFRFSLSGFVKVHVIGSNQLEADQQALSSVQHNDAAYTLISHEYAIIDHSGGASNVSLDSNSSVGFGAMGLIGNSANGASFLSDSERGWLGTCTGLAQTQPSAHIPAFLLLPIYDIGIVVGKKKSQMIGTTPGYRSALAIERQLDKLAMSDATLLEDISTFLSTSIVKLRWKDINRELRDMSLKYLRYALKPFTFEQRDVKDTSELISMQEGIYDVIITMIAHCIPGCQIRRVTQSADQQLLYYENHTHRQSHDSTAQKSGKHNANAKLVLPSEYGQDGDFFNRCFSHSFLIHNHADIDKRCITLFHSLLVQRFPRFNLIISSEDTSVGLIQIENFDGINGGMTAATTANTPSALSSFESVLSTSLFETGQMSGAVEVRKWFEEIGQLAGNIIFSNSESFVLNKLKEFFLFWEYNLDALLINILYYAPVVLRNYKMMEVLHVDLPDYRIKSLMEIRPQASAVFGQKVVINNIVVTRKLMELGNKLGEEQSQSSASNRISDHASTTSSNSAWQGLTGLFKLNKADKPMVTTTIHEESEEEDVFGGDESVRGADDQAWHVDDANSMKALEEAASKQNFLCGIRYDGVEQLQSLTYNSSSGGFSCSQDVTLYMKVNKQVTMVIYETDKHWNVLSENRGMVQLGSQQNMQQKVLLEAINSSNKCAYDMMFTTTVDKQGAAGSGGGDSQFSNLSIKSFHIQIISCRGLKMLKGKSPPSAFCEVYVDKKLLLSTAVVKQDVNPAWNHHVHIPYNKKVLEVHIDVYDMSFLRRGNFLGRIELPFEQLVTPVSAGEIEHALQPRMDFNNVKKNAYVGGVINLKFSVEKEEPVPDISASSNLRAKNALRAGVDGIKMANRLQAGAEDVASKQVLADAVADMNRLKRPILQLTIESASDLAVGNRFSGSSDPYVMVYCQSSGEQSAGENANAVAKTKVIQNNHMSPEWQETLMIPLLASVEEKSAYGLDDYPTIRLAVHHNNKLKQSTLLGEATLDAMDYMLESSALLMLSATTKKKGKNDSSPATQSQGTLTVRWSIVDERSLLDGDDDIDNSLFRFGLHRHLYPICTLDVKVVKVTNLVKLRKVWGGYNPYVALSFAGKSMGQTRNKINTSSPVFNEKFSVPLSTVGDQQFGELAMKVWSHDPLHQDIFLGECTFSYEDAVHVLATSNQESTLNLTGRVGADQVPAEGSITVKFAVHYQQQSLDVQLITSNQAHHHMPMLEHASNEAIPVILSYDPALESARQKKDQLQLPDLLNKASQQSQKYLSRPFERTGLITEAHYGQLCAAFRRAERTVLKTDLTDMACIPLFKKASEVQEVFPRYLVCRYRAQQIPRRDLRFLESMQNIVITGLQQYLDRNHRRKALEELLEHAVLLSKTSSSSPHEITLQNLLEMESVLKCSVRLYLLGDVGESFLPVSSETGKVAAGAVGNDFVQMMAKMVRHDVMLQYYRGSLRIISTAWEAFTQYQVPGIELIQDRIDMLEGPGFCNAALGQMKKQLHDGGFVIPIAPNGEMLLGVLIVKQINQLPSAMYEYFDKSTGSAEPVLMKLESLEHQQANLILQTSLCFGRSLLAARVNNVSKGLKSFSVTDHTSHQLLIRYAFRLLVTTLPAIKDISIWMVDLTATTKPAQIPDMSGMRGMSSMVSKRGPALQSTDSILNKSTMFTRWFGFGEAGPQKSTLPSIAERSPVPLDSHKVVSNSASKIKLGVFGSSNPSLLLTAPVERNLANQGGGTQAKRGKEVKADLEASKQAEWKVIPAANVFNPPSHSGEGKQSSAGPGKPLAETVLDEIRLCTQKLKQKSFRIASGHSLCALGEDDSVHQLLCDMFQVVKPQAAEGRGSSGLFRGLSKVSTRSGDGQGNGNDVKSMRSPVTSVRKADASTRRQSRQPPAPNAVSKPVSSSNLNQPAGQQTGRMLKDGSKLPSFSASSPPPPPPLTNTLAFFVAINTHGVGGQSGWGNLGELSDAALTGIVAILEAHLAKLCTLQEGAPTEGGFEANKRVGESSRDDMSVHQAAEAEGVV